MRWDHLFTDLAGQLEDQLSSEDEELAREEERLRISRLSMMGRLVTLINSTPSLGPVGLILGSEYHFQLAIESRGRDWIAGTTVSEGQRGVHRVVPVAAIVAVTMSRRASAASLRDREPTAVPAVADRLGLAFVLRDIARRRIVARVRLSTGAEYEGYLERVGRDHCELVESEETTRRLRSESIILSFSAIEWVQLAR